ncbi:HAMP domain-containing sensor histidine kinase [Actinopolymorpha sp. B17G11]|uniref:HAMP domain-containing sensor histidine kinase n=1 Tax=Actinopolymorpha sp. B17G11 TaxID=3160861 RepID=UPI0032E4CA14
MSATGMSRVVRARGLRGRVVLAFGVGALLVSAIFAVLTYGLTQSYLLTQREQAVVRQVYIDANFLRGRLETAGADMPTVLTASTPSADATIVVSRGGRWYSSSLEAGRESLPFALRAEVESGRPASMRTRLGGEPVLVVGVPLRAVGAYFYEVVPLTELQETLRILGTVLLGGALVAAAAGGGLGVWASRSVLRPLNEVASTAAQIAGGQLDTRLAATRDPDLATIVGSFNSMVDTLQQRIQRDARLAADVSHELRSPLTTLVASVEVLNTRRDELPQRSRQALDLVTGELERFRNLLDNLLELARMDAGLDPRAIEPVPLADLLGHTLRRSGRSPDLLVVESDAKVNGDKLMLERMFGNLFDNAEIHGHRLVRVRLLADTEADDRVLVLVDDDGPGVRREDRERIFERFATGRTARRSSSGTGLGLALARETVAAHGGAVWCTDRPEGGARFAVSLPRVQP